MNVRKVKSNGEIQKGNIIGIVVQAGLKEKNDKAPIFSTKYKKKVMTYLFVKSVEVDEIVVIDLETKKEHTIKNSRWNIPTRHILSYFKEEIEKAVRKVKIERWYGEPKEMDEKTYSVTAIVYPSFVVTSLANSVMNEDGTFTFSLTDVDEIYLDKMAVFKDKVMLYRY